MKTSCPRSYYDSCCYPSAYLLPIGEAELYFAELPLPVQCRVGKHPNLTIACDPPQKIFATCCSYLAIPEQVLLYPLRKIGHRVQSRLRKHYRYLTWYPSEQEGQKERQLLPQIPVSVAGHEHPHPCRLVNSCLLDLSPPCCCLRSPDHRFRCLPCLSWAKDCDEMLLDRKVWLDPRSWID